MLVICDGMPRSASTWSYNVVKELLHGSFPDACVHGAFADETAQFLAQAPPDASHLVMKSHSQDAVARALSKARAADVVYTHRDPADAVASAMWMFEMDFDGAVAAIESSIELLREHNRSGDALIVSYDEIVGSPRVAVERVASYLGLDAPPGLVDRVVAANSLQRVRERLDGIAASEQLVRHGGNAYDPETLLHPRHVRPDDERARPMQLADPQLEVLRRVRDRYEAARAAA